MKKASVQCSNSGAIIFCRLPARAVIKASSVPCTNKALKFSRLALPHRLPSMATVNSVDRPPAKGAPAVRSLPFADDCPSFSGHAPAPQRQPTPDSGCVVARHGPRRARSCADRAHPVPAGEARVAYLRHPAHAALRTDRSALARCTLNAPKYRRVVSSANGRRDVPSRRASAPPRPKQRFMPRHPAVQQPGTYRLHARGGSAAARL